MGLQPHYLLDIIIAAAATGAIAYLAYVAAAHDPRRRIRIWLLLAALLTFIWISASLGTVRIARHFPALAVGWIRCIGLFVILGTVYGTLLYAAVRKVRAFAPDRRRAIHAIAGAAVAAPAGVAAFGIVHREDLRFREVDLHIPNLPPGLNGLRIAQVTDIHLGSFVPDRLLSRAIGMANDIRPHITFVTGDLISVKGDPLDKCLELLRGLKADAGVFGCCGNHEIYAGAEDYVGREALRYGMRFLRQEAIPLQFGGSTMNLAGVDHQRRGRPYLVDAELLVAPEAFNLLLSHNPDVFPVAAKKGFDLTISGHTHGGQVQFEVIHPSLNVVRLSTPYVYGTFESGDKRMYVSRGIGTIGVPARVGAPPEVVCLRLCAI